MLSHGLSKQTLGAISNDGISDLSRDSNANTRGSGRVRRTYENGEQTATGANAFMIDSLKPSPAKNTSRWRELVRDSLNRMTAGSTRH